MWHVLEGAAIGVHFESYADIYFPVFQKRCVVGRNRHHRSVKTQKKENILYFIRRKKRQFFSADAKIDHNKYNKLKCSNWNKNELAFVLIFGRERGKRKYWTKRTTTVVLSKWKTMSGKHIEAIRIKKEPGQDEVDSSSNSTSSNATEPTRQSSLQRIQLRKERVWKIITF